MGRIGKLTTPHGDVTTPTLMPVIDLADLILSPGEMRREFGAELVMANAYLTMRNFGEEATRHKIHGILGYDGPVMTDSVTGDAELFIRKAGRIEKVTIDQLFERAEKKSGQLRGNETREIDVEVLAVGDDLKVKWAKARRIMRRCAGEPILTITLTQGRTISITEGHSLFTFQNGSVLPIKGSELKAGNFIVAPAVLPLTESWAQGDRFTISVKWYKGKKNVEVLLDEIFTAFLGLWLADGSYAPGRVKISCANDPECLDVVRTVAERFGGKLVVEDNGVDCSINSAVLQRVTAKLGFTGKSSTKRVPKLIFNMSQKLIGSFLRGYFSGNGFVSENCVGSYSSNDKLNYDIQSLLLALGVLSNVSSAGYHGEVKKYSLRMYSKRDLEEFQDKVGFLQQAKGAKIRKILGRLDGKKHSGINVRGIPLSPYFEKNSVLRKRLGKYRLLMQHTDGSTSVRYSCRTFERELLKDLPEFTILHESEILFLPIIKIDRFTRRCYVYDIEVPSCQNFVCSNIVAHNSGGYQILRYGDIEVSPEEIVRYQDSIAPDIGTILDVPTGVQATREQAAETVRVTLERARDAVKLRSNPAVAWCGPVQGGLFSDMVAESAREVGKLDYQLHAIGSPVELLEGYRYSELVDLVMAAKQNLPPQRPVHLFGAGHPMMLALAVAMGCDLFDSAAYVLYARDGRYLTSEGTLRLEELSCLPCECPVCAVSSPEKLRGAPKEEQVKLLAKHNLHVTFGELRRIRQAIVEGRLWEHVQFRCRAHPRLLEGFRKLLRYGDFIERFDPVTKPSAFYYSGEESASRPEVARHVRRLEERYEPPPLPILALMPAFEGERPGLLEPERTHLVRLVPPFGVIPEELEEVYSLGQLQVPRELDPQQIKTVTEALSHFLERHGERYERVVLFNDERRWGNALVEACERVKGKLKIISFDDKTLGEKAPGFSWGG